MSTPIERVRPGNSRTPPPVSPQLALRVAVLSSVALVMFAIIFFRLWFLQVLSGEQYVQQANANDVRPLPIPAPRGQILDRTGQPIVSSRTTNAVQIVPSALPPAGRPRLAVYRRLGALLGDEPAAHPGARGEGAHRCALCARDDQDRRRAGCADGARRASERISRGGPATGVDPRLSLRRNGGTGARLRRRGLQKRARNCAPSAASQQGTVVGQEGLEYYYDRYLRGKPGVQRVEVNAAGYPEPSSLKTTQPLAGRSLKVTLDLGLQREGGKGAAGGDRTGQGRRQTCRGGCVHGDRSAQRRSAGDGLLPELQPEQVRQTADPGRIRALRGRARAVAKKLPRR